MVDAQANDGPALTLKRFESRSDLEAALSERLWQALTDTAGGPRAVMLSGGSTPIPVYRKLAERKPQAAPGLVILFSDDRHVPSNSQSSNYHQTWPLLNALDLPQSQVLRVKTELRLHDAADDYSLQLVQLDLRPTPIGLGLLGLGADGHTASLFTAKDIERSRGRLAIAIKQRPDGMSAVSVTPKLLAQVNEPLFVVAGADKKPALTQLLNRDPAVIAWQAVSGCKRVEVWADASAVP
jgi:6-phosphogluconolactonase